MTTHATMVEAAKVYLAIRREHGYVLKVEGAQLLRFARFADESGHQGPLTTDLAVRWAMLPQNVDRTYWARRLDIVRRFALSLNINAPETEVPPPGMLGPSYRRPPPHIYSRAEIESLLEIAATLGPAGGLRPHTYVTLFGLLASTGLRISEALGLQRDDARLGPGLLVVRHAKFDKQRSIPIHTTVKEALQRYSERRDHYHRTRSSDAFFLTEHATSQKYHKTLLTFIELRQRLQWGPSPSSHPPRIHDLRHTFAVRRLLAFLEQDADVGKAIDALSAYLGHGKVTDTYWYLSAVPELLDAVSRGFEDFATHHAGGPR